MNYIALLNTVCNCIFLYIYTIWIKYTVIFRQYSPHYFVDSHFGKSVVTIGKSTTTPK